MLGSIWLLTAEIPDGKPTTDLAYTAAQVLRAAAGIAGSFVSAYLQAPITAIASIAGATGLTIAKMAIHMGKQKFERADIIDTNPVSYISYAQEKLHPAERTPSEP